MEPNESGDNPKKTGLSEKLAELPGDSPEAEASRCEDRGLQSLHNQITREKDEPSELYQPVPLTIIAIICGFCIWASNYMTLYNGGFRFDAFNEDLRPGASEAAEVVIDYASTDWLLERGERLYSNNCAACHQANAKGLPGVYPPLAASPWVIGDERLLVKILLQGLQGEIDVLGETYNGAMPAFGEEGSNWKDRDIAAVASFVRKNFGNEAEPVLPETVTGIRESIGDKSGPWIPEELLSEHPL